MKRSKAHLLRSLAVTLIACAGLASCTQDDFAGKPQGEPLPPGEYPITFTAVQALPEETPDGTPQTRVSDNGNKSSWTNGDKINVTVTGADGNVQTTTCTLDDNGDITTYTPQLYWQTTDEYTINAWYSNLTGQSTGDGSTVSLADQRSGLAYVLKAKPITANYQTTAEQMVLNFTHQLAKIRVELTGDKAADVTSVSIESYTSCTNTNGTVSTDKASTDEIAMCRVDNNTYEANVVPGYKIEKFKINGGEWQTLTTGVTPEKGKWHKVTIDVQQKPSNPDEVGTISDDGEYLISGIGTKPLTISGGSPTVILQGVNINVTEVARNKPAIAITGGSPTIKIVGKNNTLESAGSGGIMLSNNASVTITGEGKDESSLTVEAKGTSDGYENSPSVGIGAASGGAACGNISISDITLDVTSGDYGAAIGTSGHSSSCGNITISNCVVKATGGEGAAAIGMGGTGFSGISNTVGDIRITSSQVTVVLTPYWSIDLGAGIGMCKLDMFNTYTCGKIILDAGSEAELETFTQSWKMSGDPANKGYKIGKGFYTTEFGTPTVSFGGVCLNGSETVTYAEGWGSW